MKVMGNNELSTPGEADTLSAAPSHDYDVQRGVRIEATGTKSPSEYENNILQKQINIPTVNATYMTLYRYATVVDVAIIGTSAV